MNITPIVNITAATQEITQVGQQRYGFELKETTYNDTTKTTNLLFEHKKSGARLLVMKNSDTNRGFAVKFNTPADNDKGINHIIEHSVFGGSEKYQSKNMLFDLSNTTYQTFINAMTFPNMTVFPVASESEKQLMKLTDIYMDAVYHPLVLTDERIFRREGIRYDLESKDAKLTANGIVYNEMSGNVADKSQVTMINGRKALFGKNNNQSYNSGGEPTEIRNLTYKEFKKVYKKNYHPSNSLMILYGNVDYSEFLKMLDNDYLSKYSKKKINIKRETKKGTKKIVEKKFDFPVAKGTDTKNKSSIDLCYAVDDIKKIGFEQSNVLMLIVNLLERQDSVLMEELHKSKIAESYSISCSTDLYQPVVHFVAENADPAKKNEFCNVVQKVLKKLVKDGVDREFMKSMLSTQRFRNALSGEGNRGVNSMLVAALYDNLFGNSLLNQEESIKSIEAKLDKGILEKAIEKYILKNKLVALVVTTPKAGLLEKNEKDFAKVLTKKKAAMSKKEINQLVKQTKDFKTWNETSTSEEIIKSLSAITVKDLPTDVRKYQMKESKIEGVPLTEATANIDDVSEVSLAFNLESLTMDELLYCKFYSDMINNGMATSTKTEDELAKIKMEQAYGISCSVKTQSTDFTTKNAHPIWNVTYYGFNNEFKETLSTVADILRNSDVSKLETYGTRTIAEQIENFKSMFAEPLTLLVYRAYAYSNEDVRYTNYLEGLDYYHFLLKMQKDIKENPDEVVKKLQAVKEKAFNKGNCEVYFAGNEKSQKAFEKELPGCIKKLGDKEFEKSVYQLPVPAKREAIQINGSVQYVVSNSSLSKNNIGQSGKGIVVGAILDNLYMIPEIRLKGGAYGAGASFENDAYSNYSYRDSNFVNTLKVMDGTDEFLDNINSSMNQSMLDSYILSTFATYKREYGELLGASIALTYKRNGLDQEYIPKLLEEIKNTSMDDIKAYANKIALLNSTSNYAVAAPASEIEAHKDMFDAVITLE